MTPTTPKHRVRYTCPSFHDVLVDGNEIAVYVGDLVSVLSPIASLLVQSVRSGVTHEMQLVDAVVARYGVPPDGDAEGAVRSTLAALVDSGVLLAESAGRPRGADL